MLVIKKQHVNLMNSSPAKVGPSQVKKDSGESITDVFNLQI